MFPTKEVRRDSDSDSVFGRVVQFIDHAWVVALDRAQKAGVLLAHTLMAGGHGDRPVTLIGYSMGARLIFHCLLELCRHNAKGVRPAP